VSRIVSQIKNGTVTCLRTDADIVVTEWGAAQLRGKSLSERIKAMIAIAHPDHREALERYTT
jgi:acetyl-CoA hydrolase